MTQFITREDFVALIKQLQLEDLIICYVEDKGHLSETEHFIFSEDSGDVSIIYKPSLDKSAIVISWYKLYHIGRCLNITGLQTTIELTNILNILKDDLLNIDK